MADGVLVSQLRVEATAETRGYVEGMNAKVAADQRATASDRELAQATEQTDRKLTARQVTVEQLVRRNDELGRAEAARARQLQALTRDEEAYNRAVAAGSLAADQAARIAQGLAARRTALNPVSAVAATATTGAQTESALAAAAGVVREETIGRAATAMTGYASAAGAVGRVLQALGPYGQAAAAGIGAVSTVLGIGLSKMEATEQEMARLNFVLAATGNQAGVTGTQVTAMASQLSRTTGISRNEILQAASTLATFSESGRVGFETILRLSADMAAVFGGDLQGRVEVFGRTIENIAAGHIPNLSRAFPQLSVAARGAIEQMTEMGQTVQAQQRFVEELTRTVGGAAEARENTLAGATEAASREIGGIIVRLTQLSGVFERARAGAISFRDALRAARDWMSDSSITQREQATASDNTQAIRDRIAGRRQELGIDQPGRSQASVDRLNRILENDRAYQADLRLLQESERRQAAIRSGISWGGAESRENAEIGAEGRRRAAEEERAEVNRQRNLRLYNFASGQSRAEQLAGMSPQARARAEGGDRAAAGAFRAITGREYQGNPAEIERTTQALTEEQRAAIASARAQGERIVALQSGAKAGEEQTRAIADATREFERENLAIDKRARTMASDTEMERLRIIGTREAREALAQLTGQRDLEQIAEERRVAISGDLIRANEAERRGMHDLAQAYRDQAAAVGQRFDRLTAATLTRSTAAQGNVELAEQIKQIRGAGEDMGNAVGQALIALTTKTRSWSDALNVVNTMLQQVIASLTNRFFSQPLSNWLGDTFVRLFGATGGANLGQFPSQATHGIYSPIQPVTQALGGAWDRGVQMFAGGGLVDRPTMFAMAGGAGLMGEAGPEFVMPAKRMADGRLGVVASGGGSQIVAPTINIGGVTINGNVNSKDHAQQIGIAAAQQLKGFVIETIRDQMRPGGQLRPAF